ncbi:DNA-binding transcriptional LysR family regulator [Oxalobacteraceae bacterium GrIS 2.11]
MPDSLKVFATSISRLVVQDLLRQGKLVEIPSVLPKLQRQFYLIMAKKKTVSTKLMALLDFCRNWTPAN